MFGCVSAISMFSLFGFVVIVTDRWSSSADARSSSFTDGILFLPVDVLPVSIVSNSIDEFCLYLCVGYSPFALEIAVSLSSAVTGSDERPTVLSLPTKLVGAFCDFSVLETE